MQLPGQNLPLQQEWLRENLPAARTLHAAPHHCDPVTAFALSFWSKPEASLSLFLFLVHSLHPPFSESLASQNSQSTNESSRADWVRRLRPQQISAGLKPSSFG